MPCRAIRVFIQALQVFSDRLSRGHANPYAGSTSEPYFGAGIRAPRRATGALGPGAALLGGLVGRGGNTLADPINHVGKERVRRCPHQRAEAGDKKVAFTSRNPRTEVF